jgi:hypothetical protein
MLREVGGFAGHGLITGISWKVWILVPVRDQGQLPEICSQECSKNGSAKMLVPQNSDLVDWNLQKVTRGGPQQLVWQDLTYTTMRRLKRKKIET